jgi:hypothetical protein
VQLQIGIAKSEHDNISCKNLKCVDQVEESFYKISNNYDQETQINKSVFSKRKLSGRDTCENSCGIDLPGCALPIESMNCSKNKSLRCASQLRENLNVQFSKKMIRGSIVNFQLFSDEIAQSDLGQKTRSTVFCRNKNGIRNSKESKNFWEKLSGRNACGIILTGCLKPKLPNFFAKNAIKRFKKNKNIFRKIEVEILNASAINVNSKCVKLDFQAKHKIPLKNFEKSQNLIKFGSQSLSGKANRIALLLLSFYDTGQKLRKNSICPQTRNNNAVASYFAFSILVRHEIGIKCHEFENELIIHLKYSIIFLGEGKLAADKFPSFV